MKTPSPLPWKTLSDIFLRKAAFLTFIFISFQSLSQTTNISGIVNSYHRVVQVIPSKAGVRLDNTTGLGYGNLVVLAQMKGASILTANNATFGDTTSLNGAGNYEIATICAVIGDTVFFFHELNSTYDVNSKVQLVKFGEYYSADVVGTLKPMSWDSASGIGGILAIRAEEDLILNAPILADSTGYGGGSFYQHSGTCGFFNPVGTGYVYDATSGTSANGAYKGEGVAIVPSTLDGARGAPANGGGGGNNHNNGGGGGGNLSSGGNGGGNFSSGPSGCTGSMPGIGGKALSPWGNRKIFLGGGGGAGHANNTVQTYAGGKGGGIIIIIAKDIIGNGQKISANGQAGRSTSYDGASGGGAGGTIIMNIINSYTGPLTIEANGGNGGNEDDDLISGRCYGAGGGGSGGRIYFNGAAPAVTYTTNGGAAGINIDSHSGCAAPAPASAGSPGISVATYAYNTSNIPSSYCEFLLPVKLVAFEARLNSKKKVELSWEVANPDDVKTFSIERSTGTGPWSTLNTINGNDNQSIYQSLDDEPLKGMNVYRLRITGKDNSLTYSMQRRVLIRDNLTFAIYPNPARNKIIIRGKFQSATTVTLMDISGKKLKEMPLVPGADSQEFLLPVLPAGVYLVRINNFTEKLFIR